MTPTLPAPYRPPPLWSTCNAQVPDPRPDLGPQLLEAAKRDDAEEFVSLLDQGAPVDFKVRWRWELAWKCVVSFSNVNPSLFVKD